MRKKIICIICCIMLVSSGCGLKQNIRNSIKYENNSKFIDKFKGLWLSDIDETDYSSLLLKYD
mgnify:CR=1 FL=1